MPFVLAIGLSVVTRDISIIITACLFIIAIGAITMALGAYFTTKTESEHFNADIATKEEKERRFLAGLGIGEEIQNLASGEIIKENERWSTLLKEREDKNQAGRKGRAVALAYLAGGLIPLLPFFIYNDMAYAIKASLVFTLTGLLISGFIRSRIISTNPWTGTLRILIFASLAAGCAFGVAHLITA